MKERIARLQAALPEGVDGALITSDVNRRYYTGFPSSAGTLLISRSDALLVIDFRYYEAAKEKIKGCRVLLQDKLGQQLREAANAMGIRNLLVESDRLTLKQHRRMDEMLEGVILVDDDRLADIVALQRSIKSPQEVRAIEKAQHIAEDAFEKLLEEMAPGQTEQELALRLEYLSRQMGSEGPSFDFIVVSGPNGSRPHGVPGSRQIERGELITFDFGAVLDGYHSDMTRNVSIGRPDDLALEICRVVYSAQQAAIAAIKAGVNCADVDRAAREIIAQAGYGHCFGHSTGHSVGLEIHEDPAFSPLSRSVCRSGMILSVEPGIYLEGKTGCRMEDLVLIEENGCKNLNKSCSDLIIL
ncbi:MAG: aminopeptidase P family protein [Oscillospiraceae bacterium]|nr:aminopeptidase P family protein [Oscillospiraceae bacterium]